MIKTFKIQISGRVQGVGFRPYIYNLANQNKFKGNVSNDANGVLICINSTKETAVSFLEQITQNKPEVSIITDTSITEISFNQYNCFSIIPSKEQTKINIPLTPDFAVCSACVKEINDPKNRRFNYAFTTCVHCGPRYAITSKFPFERANTTLYNFNMCNDCNQEYIDPKNKRFHSQTNSCVNCGITLELTDHLGNIIKTKQSNIITKITTFITEGKIVAIKNSNGYLLCCDSNNKQAIHKLRERKKRFNKPFAVLYPSINAIQNDFNISIHEENALQSIVAPIVILNNIKDTALNVQAIAPNLEQTGVMLPSSALLQLIAQNVEHPIIATSGNIHGSPIISNKKDALKNLYQIADCFLHHDLEIEFPQDDSVVKYVNEQQIILRRSRGLSPNDMLNIGLKEQPTLAMGSHLKSTFAFIPNKHLYISQYFGNLDNFEVSNRFQLTIKKYVNLFNTTPKTILIDKHLQYVSSTIGHDLSEKWNTSLVKIQHHKAHFASVLGEHNLFNYKEKILGVIWDGTGLGDDQQIWGGEFFTYQKKKIDRLTHFEYFNWIANDKMAKEPRLSLLSILDDNDKHYAQTKFTKIEYQVYLKMLKNNTLKTSSIGRLFDAVASLLNIIDVNTFDAEAAILLENCANKYMGNNPIDLLENEIFNTTIPSKLIIKNLKKQQQNKQTKEHLAFSFIYTLAKIIITIAEKNNIKTIACSGGVFQNSVLLEILIKISKKKNLNLKFNCKLSANDENISFGQLMYHQNIKN